MNDVGLPIIPRGWASLVLAALMIALLVPIFPAGEGDLFRENLQNLVHVPLFAVVTLLLRRLQLSSRLRWQSLTACACVAMVLAVLSEMAQGMTGRTPAVGDLGANLSGILLACAVLVRGVSRSALSVRLVLLLLGGGLLAHAARPLVLEVQILRAKREAFPRLVGLEFPNGLWQAQGATRLQVVGRSGRGGGLEVRMARGSYEGLRYAVPKGVDSAGYAGLRIEAANPGEAFELGVRVDGGGRQRQYASVVVPHGNSTLHAEWPRDVVDGELVRVVLFTGEDQPARSFQILDACLVREKPGLDPAGP